MAAAQEEFSFGAKASKAVWGTLGGVILLLTGWLVGGATMGSSSPPEPQTQLATIGAVTSAAESRAQSVALGEAAKLRTEVQGDLSRHRGDLADVLKKLADVQEKQATDLSAIRSAVSRIEGQLDGLPSRRR